MAGVLRVALNLSRLLYGVSGVALVFMMLLTVLDVILRLFGRPITGTYELVAFSSVLVIGFGLPYTSWTKGHVYMEFLIERLPKGSRDVVNISTRIIGILLFLLAAVNLMIVGSDLIESGEVSPTLQLPFYPVAFAAGVSCFILCLILICDILKIAGDHYE